MTSEFDKINLRSVFFDNADIHFMLFDKDLNIIDVNESLLKHYHIQKKDLIGKHILEISPDAREKGLYDKYLEVIRSGNPIVIDDIISDPIYGNRHNRIKAFKVGEGLGATASNITELKNAIEALEMFSYKAFHDIKAPISNILGITDLSIHGGLTEKELIDYLILIREQTEKLEVSIQYLITNLKLWQEKNKIEKIDFFKIVEEVKNSISFMNGFDKIRFNENILNSMNFYGDKIMLSSLFQNLIDNSIKYRDPKKDSSFINIIITDENEFVKIVVEDNGIGIEESLQKDVFKMFFRATDQASGSGLGLYTVRQGVEKCGGHIRFESKKSKGTTFTIFIPNSTPENN